MTRYEDYVKEKDVQMLAMLSMLVLQTELRGNLAPKMRVKNTTSITALTARMASVDYFSFTNPPVNTLGSNSPEWPSSPVAPSITPSFSSSNSSRGSWSSLFNTGTVRQFMNGVQGSLKEGLLTPTEFIPSHGMSRSAEKLRATGSEQAVGESPKRRMRQNSLQHARVQTVISGVQQTFKPTSSAGHRSLRNTDSSSFTIENQVVIFEPARHEDM
jgi:WD repeat-containing protein 59